MKGGTPTGPSVSISATPTPMQLACASVGMRPKPRTTAVTTLGRTYWPPIPTAIARRTEVVTSGEDWPHAVKSRSRIWPARARESARKKIHAKQTIWKVRIRPNHCARRDAGRQPSARSTQRPDAVDPAPDHERPGGAVPEPAEEHRQHEVAVRRDPSLPVAAERDVEVVAQPARERHVPAAPEVLERDGRVRRVEVLREDEPEEEGDPDRDVRVPAEVREDLDGVAVDGDEHLERGVAVRRREDLVDDVRREVVRDHHLQEEPAEDEDERARGVDAARISRRLELREELARPHDRARDEVREERLEDGEARERAQARARPGTCRRRTRSP